MKSYRESLPAKIAEAVRQAESRLTPVTISTARGRESSIAFNRRFHMKDGTVGWNPGKGNPAIVKPAGTIDPDVPVVFFETADHKPVATYVNYAVHLDNIGEPLISADMPATLSRCLADFKGPEMVTLFTAGCCGDVNHIDVNWKEPQRGFGNPARMGTILAGEALRTWPRLASVETNPLRIKSTTVSLPLRRAQERRCRESPRNGRSHERRGIEAARRSWRLVEAFKVLDVAGKGRQAARSGSAGDRPGKRGRLGVAAGRGIHRARPGHQARLAFPHDDHRRAGQRPARIHPVAASIRPGQL